ncbi:GNAT family N-acetyltransferase [Natronolimnohabitans sp. A-GB9]|uniref:GNAT family N-acetyltransferase n=1 Tax=Natronolimnohabitans sp. A-GB9 TaxID=3069757 RepID=UPI0027B07D9E|nr:GNAT family N-acetyltransferase [Natronolimnohabitans sp. A-GB9]MDQ2050700.1 GNAT family N-acetyltransferase [Natronolimnohabitans sp. A-GB9]
MGWTVRRATPDVAPAVRDVARESWHAAYDDVLGRRTVAATIERWYDVTKLRDSIVEARNRNDAVFLVAADEDDGEIVGFAQAGPHREHSTVASLYRLYVHPDRWGEGIGTALLERLEDDLSTEYDRLWLAVLADNDVGVSFYESTGFERVGTQESDLKAGLEEYVYEKQL